MTQLPTLGQPTTKAAKTKTFKSSVVNIGVPLLDFEGYSTARIEIKRLTAKQQETLGALRYGLENSEAKLINGREVRNAADAVRWLLEEVARTAGW